jgi:hypothetical protein
MRPVSYGYLAPLPGDDAGRGRCRLAAYAEREGLAVAEVFIERPWPRAAAFAALLDALDWSGGRDVVMLRALPAGVPTAAALAKRGARIWVAGR